MMRLVMFAKVFPRAMETGLHRGDARIESFGNLGVTPAFLYQCEQRSILRPQLAERVAQGVEFLGVHCAGRLGDILMFLTERQKDPAQLLSTQLIDARI